MLRKTLTPIEDDTEEAPWMAMGTPESETVFGAYGALRAELCTRHPPLFVACRLPIRYQLNPGSRVEQLAPDILVAPIPPGPRDAYSIDAEGVPPSFVLEVVSPESWARDLQIKPDRYAAIGIREYALFAPETAEGMRLLQPPLQGYRLDPASGEYLRREADAEGRLYSEVLELWLAVRDGELRAQRRDGSWLTTLQEEVRAREEEAQARAAAERELARLRAELEEYKRKQR